MSAILKREASPTLPAVDEAALAALEQQLPGVDLSGALATFAEELGKRFAELGEKRAAGDDSELASMAHGLKGSAATFCAPALAAAALHLEQTIASDDDSTTAASIEQLQDEIERATAALRTLLASRAEGQLP